MKPSKRVFYNIFVGSFFDSNGDGIGDLNGVALKLDYLKSLGISGLWLSPIHPSKSYHKYDVQDYREIDSDFGTLDDFRNLLAEAKKRDIVVLLDLVINHTDDNHDWFQKSQGGDPHYRQFYNWSKPENIPKGDEGWYEQSENGGKNNSEEKFYGFFWKGMPDLNFDYQPVRDSVKAVAKYWLDFGVDGFRLDAALHIYPFYTENRERNMWKTIAWWEEFSDFVKITKPGAFTIGEVWESEAVVREFTKNGLDANFNFTLSEKLLKALKAGQDSENFVEFLANYRDDLAAVKPDFEDAIFLTNHDQNRIASELDGDTSKIKLAASLLLTLPGTPFLYYGEELGMLGVKPDEQIREPMIWNDNAEVSGQTTAQEIIHNLNSTPASLQFNDPNSILNHYRNLIAFRKSEPLITSGEFSWLNFEGKPKAMASYVFRKEKETLFVFHNLSDKTFTFNWLPISEKEISMMYRGSVKGEQEGAKITISGYGTVVVKK